jgi:hypothetical protein
MAKAKGENIPGYDPRVIHDSWRPTCPFCHAKWTDEMMQLEAYASGGCETCGPEASAKVEIKCGECRRLIYVKEYN